jgi:tripartite-type tricarboxylate transporter receptor subunit TctC
MPTRRLLLTGAAAALAAPALAAFPERPVRLVVPYAAGGNADLVARMLAPGMQQRLGQPVVVENRVGGGGTLGAEGVARSRADGHTLLVGSNGPLSVNPVLQALPYDALRDFTPIAMASRVPLTLTVGRGVPATTLAEFVALAKARPGGLNVGSTGVGSGTHLTLARLAHATGAPLVHVPFRGGGALGADLISGTVDGVVVELNTALGLAQGGQARILAVAAGRRAAAAPDVPTMIEAGLAGFTAASFVGLVAPTGTAPEVMAALRAAMLAALDSAEVRARIVEGGGEPSGPDDRTEAGFGAFLREEMARTRDAAKLAGLSAG